MSIERTCASTVQVLQLVDKGKAFRNMYLSITHPYSRGSARGNVPRG
jgi:hypothetical protein